MINAVAPTPEAPTIDDFDARKQRFFRDRAVDLDAQSVVFALFRAQADVFSTIERAALRPLGLTHAGFVTLMSLWMLGPLETRKLSAVLGTSRPAVVSAVNTLEARRWVRRTRSNDDRRLVTVDLTAAGRKIVERAQAATHVYERRFAGALTRSEQRTLTRLLARVDAAARDAAQDART